MVHFHSYGHSRFSDHEPPPAWVSTGSADGFVDVTILGVVVLVLVVRFLWRLAGVGGQIRPMTCGVVPPARPV